jgi:hypothetical protein
MAQLVTDLCQGRLGTPPASIGFLSGDVHFSYLARLTPARAGSTAVYQAVCSPIRNPLPRPIRLLNGVASFGAAGVVGRALARLARVPRAPLTWTLQGGPHFHNALGTLDLHRDRVEISWDAPETSSDDPPPLQQLAHQHIT